METGDEAQEGGERQGGRGGAAPQDRLEGEQERLVGLANRRRAGRDARVEEQREDGGGDEREDAPAQRLRHIADGVAGLLRRERNLLDGEVEPDGERHRVGDAQPAERQEARGAALRLDVEGGVPTELGNRGDPEYD